MATEKQIAAIHGVRGVSLRDWFAGQALAGFIAAWAHPRSTGVPTPTEAADYALECADAMLRARAADGQEDQS